ncbi:MAG: helix-turn-helix transcriptional regulator [Lentisphaeria bacterium]|nr:helix-turn-helix transcriptional regulator [Lentisphaeria bacterium]
MEKPDGEKVNRIPMARHFRPAMPMALRFRDYSETSDVFHCHEFHELVLVLGGSGEHVTEEHSYPVFPGDIFLIRPPQFHGYRKLRQLRIANFLYMPDCLGPELDSLKSLLGYYIFFESDPHLAAAGRLRGRPALGDGSFAQARELTLRMQREQQEKIPGWEFQFRLLFLELMLLICRTFSDGAVIQSAETVKIGRILRYFDENYSRPVTLDELARQCGCSVPTLTRLFRETMQDSPIDYLNRLRLEKAAGLLRDTRLPVGEIARRTGFCDSNYLSKRFSRRFGLSPRAFRNRER